MPPLSACYGSRCVGGRYNLRYRQFGGAECSRTILSPATAIPAHIAVTTSQRLFNQPFYKMVYSINIDI